MAAAGTDVNGTGAGAASIDELFIADEPERWAALGFDVQEGCCRLGAVQLTFIDRGDGRGITGWSLRGAASTELDGLPTTLSARPPASHAPAHANGVVAIDHIVAMSPDLDRSVRALQDAGLDLRRIRDQPTAAGAPRQAFFRLGKEILEIVQEPAEVLARSDGLEGPARFWGLALCSGDLGRTAEFLGERVGPVKAAVQPGRRIATLRRGAGLSVPLALMSAAEPGR